MLDAQPIEKDKGAMHSPPPVPPSAVTGCGANGHAPRAVAQQPLKSQALAAALAAKEQLAARTRVRLEEMDEELQSPDDEDLEK